MQTFNVIQFNARKKCAHLDKVKEENVFEHAILKTTVNINESNLSQTQHENTT